MLLLLRCIALHALRCVVALRCCCFGVARMLQSVAHSVARMLLRCCSCHDKGNASRIQRALWPMFQGGFVSPMFLGALGDLTQLGKFGTMLARRDSLDVGPDLLS